MTEEPAENEMPGHTYHLDMAFREGRLVEALVGMADTLVSDFDVVDLFYRLVDSCPDLLDVDEAGLLLTDANGALWVVATSSESTQVVELLELQNEGGPGLDAFRSGEEVTSGPLTGAKAKETWPTFTMAAQAAGFKGVTAIPMRLRGQVLGALSLFATEEGELSSEDLTVARALANMATIAILQDRTSVDYRILVSQLQIALDSRVVIEQAKGIVAQDAGWSMDEAFGRIRWYARDTNQRLREVAARVVSGDLKAADLAGDA
jgi:GAF domain-containing protein